MSPKIRSNILLALTGMLIVVIGTIAYGNRPVIAGESESPGSSISANDIHDHTGVDSDSKAPKPVTLTDKNINEGTSTGVVLVDFWAPWCSWCRRLAPTIDKLARDYDGKAVIAKLNTDDYPRIAGRYGIRGLPTMLLFKDGKRIQRLEGFRPETVIRKVIDEALAD